MRIWTILMISILTLAFAMPVMACDACNKDGPTLGILANLDIGYQPVLAMVGVDYKSTTITNKYLEIPNSLDQPVAKGSTMILAVLINHKTNVIPCARDVDTRLNLLALGSINGNELRSDGEGGILLRQGTLVMAG